MFHGWRIVGVAFVTLFVSVGFGFYSYGAFFNALAAEFGGSRLGVGIGMMLFTVTNGLLAPWLGRQIAVGSIKNVMTAGVVALVVGFALMSRVRELWQFYVVLGTLVAGGAACLGGLVGSTLVSNWFVRRRGMALGVATMGISLSGVVMAPVATELIARIGWRHAFLAYGLATLVVVLPAVRLLVIGHPESIGLHPDGDPGPPEEEGPHAQPPRRSDGWRLLSHRNFWIIAVVVALNFCANGAILTHIIPHATDLGFAPRRAALTLSVLAGLGVLGKVVFGWVSDHIDVRLAVWLATTFQCVAALGFLWARDYGVLLVVAAVFGLGMGGLVPLWGSMIGASFGRREFGRVMGLMTPVMVPLQSVGVPLAGYIYDSTGTYDLAFKIFGGLYALSMLWLALLRVPASRARRRGAPSATLAADR